MEQTEANLQMCAFEVWTWQNGRGIDLGLIKALLVEE